MTSSCWNIALKAKKDTFLGVSVTFMHFYFMMTSSPYVYNKKWNMRNLFTFHLVKKWGQELSENRRYNVRKREHYFGALHQKKVNREKREFSSKNLPLKNMSTEKSTDKALGPNFIYFQKIKSDFSYLVRFSRKEPILEVGCPQVPKKGLKIWEKCTFCKNYIFRCVYATDLVISLNERRRAVVTFIFCNIYHYFTLLLKKNTTNTKTAEI